MFDKEYLKEDAKDELINEVNFENITYEFDDTINNVIVAKAKKTKSNTKSKYPRDPKQRSKAIIEADFKCEVNDSHKTFITNATNKPYVEAHHLIPRSAQKDYVYNIDHNYNIVALCSNCHNKLHYGLFEEKEPVLKQLYNNRKDKISNLDARKDGLEFTYKTLLNYYK